MGAREVANLMMVANHLATIDLISLNDSFMSADDFLPMQGPFQDGKACAQDTATGQWYIAWLTVDGRARVDFYGDLNTLTLWEVDWDEKVPNKFWPIRQIHNRQFDYT